jgi:hypothetical protein
MGIALLAIIHFVYEAILAPSFRLKLRCDLFLLRDELRSLKVDHAEMLDDKHFTYLQDSINSIILMIPRFEIGTVAMINRELEKDKSLEEKVQKRVKLLDDCAIPEVAVIRKKSLHLAFKALLINGGMCFLYILPMAILSVLYKAVANSIRAVISVPKPDLDKIAPYINSSKILAT